MDSSQLMSLYELSRAYKVDPDVIRREAFAGLIPCLRMGRRLFFNPAAVTKALSERAATSTLTQPPPAQEAASV